MFISQRPIHFDTNIVDIFTLRSFKTNRANEGNTKEETRASNSNSFMRREGWNRRTGVGERQNVQQGKGGVECCVWGGMRGVGDRQDGQQGRSGGGGEGEGRQNVQ